MDKETFVETSKGRFGTTLEAAAVSKGETRALILIREGQQDRFVDTEEFSKIGQYGAECHGPDIFDNAFSILLRNNGGDI
jgi:hypothetical protein